MGKEHHYVPRFYLKRFSINAKGKCISLYNINNKKFIQSAPIRHQACRPFLYGKDDLVESELAKLESTIAQFFHYWIDHKILELPKNNTPAFDAIKRYILYQIFRTVRQGSYTSELVNQVFKILLKETDPARFRTLEDGRIQLGEPEHLNILFAYDKDYLLNFMEGMFVVNLSSLPFITSDAPIVRYNQLMENIGIYTGATVPVVKGLQIFFPIHERLMLCLFDPKVYDCEKRKNDYVVTESPSDIHQLNALQYINCESQLFFDEYITPDYIEDLFDQVDHIRSKVGPVTSTYKNRDRTQLFISHESAQINLELSFFTLRQSAKEFEHKIAPLRHESLKRKS